MYRQVKLFPKVFWFLAILHMLFSNLHNLFAGFAVAMLVEEKGYQAAGMYISLYYL